MEIVRSLPAGRWGEAFPLGNGHMGAMVYSSLPLNRIDLTENTFYSGSKSKYNNQKNAAKAFYRMRELASRGEFDKVHKAAEKFIGIRNNYGTNLPVGHLSVDHGVDYDKVSGFERTLDLFTGTAKSIFYYGGYSYQDECFLSHPDNILLEHIRLEKAGGITVAFSPSNEYGKVIYKENTIQFICHAYELMHCDELCGVTLAGSAVIVTDGICTSIENGISVTQANDIKIYLHMRTDFKREFVSTEIAEQRLLDECMEHVVRCIQKDVSKIKKEHEDDIKKFMKRVDFKLESKDETIKLLPVLFQYGRYLLLASSREDSKLPAHLQGIWNDNVACRIGWTCDMHLDINTQMNYWPSLITGLSETDEPLFRWIKEDLAKAGAVTAKESYGLDGWVGELVSNAWGYAAPYWASPIAPCPTGGIWVMMQMWEYYCYSEDQEFLKEYMFPLLESAVEFFDAYLFREENSGYYTCGPSISPENSFIYKNRPYQISNGCTYELLMIRELFTVYLNACIVLQEPSSDLQNRIHEKLECLMPYRITAEGTIAEWSHDLEPADFQHRHTSHLLGLFPFSQITPEETPDLCEAVKKTLHQKLTPLENWEDTGWARSMLMLYEARLKNGEAAYYHIKSMVKDLLEPNDMVYHPPTRGAGAFDHVYELDGNTGLTTCIGEMLLQSHKGVICLLPALPKEWDTGSISGLVARGNITIEIEWENTKLHHAKLVSKQDKTVTVFYAGQQWILKLKSNIPYIIYP